MHMLNITVYRNNEHPFLVPYLLRVLLVGQAFLLVLDIIKYLRQNELIVLPKGDWRN